MSPPTFTREELHAEALRELRLRKRNYPKWLREGHGWITQEQADRQIALQEAIVAAFAPPPPPDLFSTGSPE